MVFRFLAGLTKLENITQNIIQQLLRSHSGEYLLGSNDKLTLFHWLFESHSDATTVKVLCLDEMHIWLRHAWTPLDFYITGYCVAHSQYNWSLDSVVGGCIDDEKVELFSKGCLTSSTTTDSGCISVVNVGGGNITSEGIVHFLNIPQHIRQGIRKLSLMNNKLDGHACDLLAKAVQEMPMFEKLDFDNNEAIGNGGAVSLIRALYTSRVKTLRLNNTGIGERDCECLSELSKSNHHLKHLHIGDNHLSSESVEMITRGVAHSSSLRTLDMSYSQFSVAAVVNLASLLSDQSNCKLERLYLQDCHIGSESAAELATVQNTTLRQLDLGGNPIGDHVEGVAAIATLLIESKSLILLWLEDCHISGQGAGKLAAALYMNPTLETLKLSGNPIGDHVEGVAAIATLLIENKSLKWLEIRDCHISGQGAGELAAALYKNSTLQALDLDRNPIGVEGASSMSYMLQHNTSLTILYMCDDSVGEEGVHQLMNCLTYNRTLWELRLPEKYMSETSDRRIQWWWLW